jgi:hypothetical protein
MLHLDPSNSSSLFTSRKCKKVATNVDHVRQWTPLVATTSIWPSSSSTTIDRDAAREDGPSTLSSTKSQTHVAEVRRVSSTTSTCRRAVSSTSSHSVASSGLIGWQNEEQVIDLHVRPLEPQAQVL